MKKSTRILITLMGISVGLTAAIPITLKYKLHKSMFTRLGPARDFPLESKAFENVRVVTISGVTCDLISSDSFYIELEKKTGSRSQIVQRGDTLFVSASHPSQRVRIFSRDLTVMAKQSDITVRGSMDPSHFSSYVIDLDSSKLLTQPIGSDWRIFQHVGNLAVKGIGKSSSVTMTGSVRMGKLYLYDIASIALDESVYVSDLKVEYAKPVTVRSHSQDGEMMVQVQ